jgi:hypothetical protein
MERGQTFSRTFDEPGVYPYFCTFHGTPEGDGMAGYVIVGDVPDYDKPQPDNVEPVETWTGNTITVPVNYATIQEAVDAAEPGDMVFIEPGVYAEAVTVRTPSLTIRGADRNTTILDGEFERSNGLHVVADAVAVENLTARNYEVNGFYWTGVTGYRGSYLTAHNNGDYGIYAFDSVDGLFEFSYGSGNRDSAFYIGQCYPCNAVVTDVVSEANKHSTWSTPVWTTVYHTCSGINLPFSLDLYGAFLLLGGQADAVRNVPPGSDHRLWPVPGPQDNMPDTRTAPGRPAFEVFVKPDLASITTPELPEGTEIRTKEITVSGVPITDPTVWTFVFALWAYFLPLALVGAWMALALWDIVRRQDEMSRAMTIAWFLAILLIPFLGVIAYFIFGKSKIEAWLRGLFVGGGALAYLVVVVVLIVISGAI